jgi:hypothetical protein
MSSIEVRPFRRSDRAQLTDLVNAHAEAVVPGMSVSVNAVLSQLERDPGEFISCDSSATSTGRRSRRDSATEPAVRSAPGAVTAPGADAAAAAGSRARMA